MSQSYEESHRQMNHDDRSSSRAESALDYYSQLPASRDTSPAWPEDSLSNKALPLPLSADAIQTENGYPNHTQYSEFGTISDHDSDLNTESAQFSRVTFAKATPGTLFRPSTVANDPIEGHIGKSSSFSRIPIFKDSSAPVGIYSSALPRSKRANPRSTSSMVECHELPSQVMNSSSMTRSLSLPLDQLSLQHNQTTNGSLRQHKFDSMPARRAKSRTDPSVRRAASTSSSYRPGQRDSREQRENQMRRLQAINQAPTGPPPWLGKFQPDPRLPAEQQMLPTVARKLALERWKSEGGLRESFDDMWAQTAVPLVTSTQEFTSSGLNDRKAATPAAEAAIDLHGPEHATETERTCEILERSEGSPVCGQTPPQRSSKVFNTPNFSRRSPRNPVSSESTRIGLGFESRRAPAPPCGLISSKGQDLSLTAQKSSPAVEDNSVLVDAKSSGRINQMEGQAAELVRERKETEGEKPRLTGAVGQQRKVTGCCVLM